MLFKQLLSNHHRGVGIIVINFPRILGGSIPFLKNMTDRLLLTDDSAHGQLSVPDLATMYVEEGEKMPVPTPYIAEVDLNPLASDLGQSIVNLSRTNSKSPEVV